MPRSDDFYDRVYEIVARIPPGRVTTYGRIAQALGSIRGARMVGWALLVLPTGHDLPCHRVVNRVGELSGGWHFGHPDIMRARLLEEGIPFRDEYQVDLARCLWEPWADEEADSATANEMDDLDLIPGGEQG